MTKGKRAIKYRSMLAVSKDLAEMADRACAFDKLTDVEKKMLERQRNQLDDAIKSLIDIFDAHDAHDPLHLGPVHLSVALYAAFDIGNKAIKNPIIRRFQREGAARAAQARSSPSKLINDVIEKAAASYLPRVPRWTDNRIAKQIIGDVNKKLRARRRKKLKIDAIRKRIHELRPEN